MVTPSVGNYYIGKGVVAISTDAGWSWPDPGNVPEIEITPEIEQLEHFSSRAGTRTKDLTVVTSKSATLRLVMDEFVLENLTLALLGTVQTAASGYQYLEIFAQNAINAQVRFVGTNEVGKQLRVELNSVDFLPGAAVPLISEEFVTLEVNGEVSAVNGSFGRVIDLGSVSGTFL